MAGWWEQYEIVGYWDTGKARAAQASAEPATTSISQEEEGEPWWSQYDIVGQWGDSEQAATPAEPPPEEPAAPLDPYTLREQRAREAAQPEAEADPLDEVRKLRDQQFSKLRSKHNSSPEIIELLNRYEQEDIPISEVELEISQILQRDKDAERMRAEEEKSRQQQQKQAEQEQKRLQAEEEKRLKEEQRQSIIERDQARKDAELQAKLEKAKPEEKKQPLAEREMERAKAFGQEYVDAFEAMKQVNPMAASVGLRAREAKERGDEADFQKWQGQMKTLLDAQEQGKLADMDTKEAERVLGIIADYSALLRGTASGLTLGMGGIVFDELINSVSGEGGAADLRQRQSGLGTAAGTAAELAGGLRTAGKVISMVPHTAAKTTAEAILNRAAVQGAIGGTQATLNSLAAYRRGEIDKGEVAANVGAGTLSSLIAAPIAANVPGKLMNAVAQVAGDLLVDYSMDKAFTNYLDDQSFMDWFINRELINLTVSAAGAGLDLKGAYQQKQEIRKLIKDGLTRTINLKKGGGIPEAAPEASRQTTLEQQRLEEEAVQRATEAEASLDWEAQRRKTAQAEAQQREIDRKNQEAIRESVKIEDRLKQKAVQEAEQELRDIDKELASLKGKKTKKAASRRADLLARAGELEEQIAKEKPPQPQEPTGEGPVFGVKSTDAFIGKRVDVAGSREALENLNMRRDQLVAEIDKEANLELRRKLEIELAEIEQRIGATGEKKRYQGPIPIIDPTKGAEPTPTPAAREELESPLTRKLTGPQFVDERGVEITGMTRPGEESEGKVPVGRLEAEAPTPPGIEKILATLDGITYERVNGEWINRKTGEVVRGRRRVEQLEFAFEEQRKATKETPDELRQETPRPQERPTPAEGISRTEGEQQLGRPEGPDAEGEVEGPTRESLEEMIRDLPNKQQREVLVEQALKYGVDPKGKGMQGIIDAIVKQQEATTVKSKVMRVIDAVEQAAREDLKMLRKQSTVGANKPLGMAVDYTIIGAAKIARGTVKFAEWSKAMIAEFGETIRPYLRDIYGRSKSIAEAGHTEPEQLRSHAERITSDLGKKMHQTAKRLPTDLGYVGKAVEIKKSPEAYYQPKTIEEIGEQNPNVARFANAVKEKQPIEEVMKLSEQALKEVGSGAQLMRYMRELYDSTPEGIVITTRAAARKAGADLPPAAVEKVNAAAEKSIAARNAAKVASDEYANNPTKENKQAAMAAEKEAYKAEIEISDLQHRYVPLDPWDVLTQSMRMGVMKPTSLIANLWGNAIIRPTATLPMTVVRAGIDKIRSSVTGAPREATLTAQGIVDETTSFLKAIKTEIPYIYRYGFSAEQAKAGEQFRSLSPLRAARQVWKGDFAINPETGKPLASDRVARSLEAILGAPAEAIGRSLAAGDVPFKRSAKARLLAEQAKLLGVPVNKVEDTLRARYPERLEKLEQETLSEVFQEKNVVGDVVSYFYKKIREMKSGGGATEFALRGTGIAPMFTQTPVNIVKQASTYALGPLSVVRGMAQMAGGNIRAGETTIAKGIVGTMYHLAALWVLSNAEDAVTGSPSKLKEERELQYSTVGPYKINLTAIKRKMRGGNSTPQDGDEWIDFSKAGYLGVVMAINKELYDQSKRKDFEGEAPTAIWEKSLQTVLETARFTLNSTFAQGTSIVLDALTSGDEAKIAQWTRNVERAFLSTVAPATLEDVGRSMREYLPEKRSARSSQSFANVVKDRFSFMGYTKDLPPRRGLFGEPIKQTPEGSNPVVYHLLNTIKSTSGKIPQHYRDLDALYRRTYDLAVIPNIPKRTLIESSELSTRTYQLDDEQWNRLQQLVGEARMKEYIRQNPMRAVTDNLKIKKLENVYSEGLKKGKEQFLKEYRSRLEIKKEEKKPYKPKTSSTPSYNL